MNKMTDYSVVIMAHFARHELATMSAMEVAAATHISPATVGKLLKLLTQHGLLVSQRGVRGGYRLNRSFGVISLADVIEAIEGPVELTECCQATGGCQLRAICATRDSFIQVNEIVHRALRQVPLAQMIGTVAAVGKEGGKR